MTYALQRLSAAIFGWIPDISGIPPRRQVTLGVVVSVLLHLLALLLVALLIGGKPAKQPMKIAFAKPKIKMRTIEITILEPEPEPEPFVPFTMEPPIQPFIDSDGLNIAKEAALDPIFQADENMRAASELAATGSAPLPTQEGRDRPFNAFKTQKSLLGMVAQTPMQVPDVPPLAAPPLTKSAPQEPPPSPPKIAEKTEPAPPKPPEPMKEVDKPRGDEIALSAQAPPVPKPDQVPSTPAPAPPAATPRPIEQQAMLTTPAPAPPAATPRPIDQQAMLTTPAPKPPPRESEYQPEQEQNRIEGSISNRGKKSVDAVATPMGKFQKLVNSLIGSRWLYYVNNPPQPGLYAFGTARVSFFINSNGKIEEVKVLSNTSNQSFADMCVAAISDARRNDADKFRPPDGTAETMRDGRLEHVVNFTLYPF